MQIFLYKYCYENRNNVRVISFNIKQKPHQQLRKQLRRACAQVNQQQQFRSEGNRQESERTSNNVYTIHNQHCVQVNQQQEFEREENRQES